MLFHHLPARILTHSVIASCCLFSVTACSSLTSDLRVPAGETFVLGGGEKGGFTVQAKNNGSVVVSLASRNPKGTVTDLGKLAPGATETLSFQAGDAALILNTSATNARLGLKITGKVPSGMGYEKPSGTRKN